MNFFKQFQAVFWFFSLAAGIVVFVYNTFATQSALAEKETNIKIYVDQKQDAIERELGEMRAVLDRIDQRVYELKRTSGP